MTKQNFGPEEVAKLEAIEALVNSLREEAGQPPVIFSSRAAERIAKIVGSWKFLLGQASLLVVYITFNKVLSTVAFDPYPFILLNLFLSFQAAFTAPIILMAQNRTDNRDRKSATRAYRTIGRVEELVKLIADMDDAPTEKPDVSDKSVTST